MTTPLSPGPSEPIRPTVVVFDIDGVLADVRHRLHFLQRRPKNWDGFFAAAGDDPVLTEGRDAALLAAQAHEVVYLTGRPSSLEQVTRSWLAVSEFPPGRLLMRRHTDRRPARRVKVEVLRRLAADHEVVMVVDDDASVVAAIRSIGLPVTHAEWMPEDEALQQVALFDAQEHDGRT
jgi:phosphoglycolate phosphatase-like HAD superfamily hydrolase